MRCRVREMTLDESRLMIRYFCEADADFLDGMGVDPAKMPSQEAWFALLEEDFARPLSQRDFYYLVWEVDGAPVGHCNINKIETGHQASMHLHIWEAKNRLSGRAPQLVQESVEYFFERFDLQQLYCEPHALNPAPNRTLPKAGFRLLKTYETMPGWITFLQPVNHWVLDRQTALAAQPDPRSHTDS